MAFHKRSIQALVRARPSEISFYTPREKDIKVKSGTCLPNPFLLRNASHEFEKLGPLALQTPPFTPEESFGISLFAPNSPKLYDFNFNRAKIFPAGMCFCRSKCVNVHYRVSAFHILPKKTSIPYISTYLVISPEYCIRLIQDIDLTSDLSFR